MYVYIYIFIYLCSIKTKEKSCLCSLTGHNSELHAGCDHQMCWNLAVKQCYIS